MSDSAARAIAEGRVVGHVLAMDCHEAGPIFLIVPIPTWPPDVKLRALSEPPIGKGTRLASVGECARLAVLMFDQATICDPGLVERDSADVNDLFNLLWPAVRRVIGSLLRPGGADNELRRILDREAQWRADALVMSEREAARRRGLVEAERVIKALIAIAAEKDVTTRAAALAALAPELRKVLPE